MKSPGQASIQVLQPIHFEAAKLNDLISFPRLTGFFSEMKILFHGQVCEHNPHLIHLSSSTVIGVPYASRVIAPTGHGSTQLPHPTQSAMYTGPLPDQSKSYSLGSATPGIPITSTGQMSTHF